jgi:hypothetical protein
MFATAVLCARRDKGAARELKNGMRSENSSTALVDQEMLPLQALLSDFLECSLDTGLVLVQPQLTSQNVGLCSHQCLLTLGTRRPVFSRLPSPA